MEMLGPPKYTRDIYSGNDQAGVVTGLAWTAAGGEILFVETSLSKGNRKTDSYRKSWRGNEGIGNYCS